LEEHLCSPTVEFEIAELVDFEEVDASVTGDRLAQLLVIGGLDELVHQGCGGGVADAVAGHGGRGAQRDEQVGLAGAGVPDQTERVALGDPVTGGQAVDDGRVDVGVGGVVELAQGLLAREVGGPDAAFGPAAVAVLALGKQEFGEEPGVGEPFALRAGDGRRPGPAWWAA
jgi:hypothetical protein